MRRLAMEVLDALDPSLREICRVLPADRDELQHGRPPAGLEGGVPWPERESGPEPSGHSSPGRAAGPVPEQTGIAIGVQAAPPVPGPAEPVGPGDAAGPVSGPEGPESPGQAASLSQAAGPVPGPVGPVSTGQAAQPAPGPAGPASQGRPGSQASPEQDEPPAAVRPPVIQLESGPPPAADRPDQVAPLAGLTGLPAAAEAGSPAAEAWSLAAAAAPPVPAAGPPVPAAGPPVPAAGPPGASSAGPAGSPPTDPPAGAASRDAAATPNAALLVQPVPRPEACVIPPARGLDRERGWVRKTMSGEYDGAANYVLRVLSQAPGLRGDAPASAPDPLTDLVAVRLYLTGQPQQLDDAARTGQAGPHVPFGRCVAAGLRRLPSYRGAARLRATLDEAQWQWYSRRRVVTEWAFCPALSTGHALPGTVEFLIWSMTARRVSLLEPSLPGQVIFLPGTSFKVLRVEAEEQHEVVLRELAAAEIGADGTVEAGHVPLDDAALAGLDRALGTSLRDRPGDELPAGYEGRFASPPGLIVTASAHGGRQVS